MNGMQQSPEKEPHRYELMFDKGSNSIEKEQSFQQMMLK